MCLYLLCKQFPIWLFLTPFSPLLCYYILICNLQFKCMVVRVRRFTLQMRSVHLSDLPDTAPTERGPHFTPRPVGHSPADRSIGHSSSLARPTRVCHPKPANIHQSRPDVRQRPVAASGQSQPRAWKITGIANRDREIRDASTTVNKQQLRTVPITVTIL